MENKKEEVELLRKIEKNTKFIKAFLYASGMTTLVGGLVFLMFKSGFINYLNFVIDYTIGGR